MRRRLRKVFLVLAAIIAAYVLAGIVCDILIWAEFRRIGREGDPVSIAQLSVLPPDSQNGAIVYDKAFRLMHAGKFKALWDIGFEQERAKHPVLWTQAKSELARFTPVVRLAREAASMPRCRLKADWEAGYFPRNSDVRTLAHLLAGSALLLAHYGKPDEALSMLRLSVRVADSLRPDALYLHLLIRGAIYVNSSDIAYEIASNKSVNENEARALSDTLGQGGFEDQIRTAAKWERVTGCHQLDRVATHGLPYDLRDEAADPQVRFACSWVGRPVLRANELSFLLSSRRTIPSIGVPLRNLPKPPDKPRTYSGCQPRSIWPLSNVLYLDPDPYDPYSYRRAVDTFEAQINGARIAIATRIYKQRFGQYPENLTDLRKLGWKLDLIDPFTGRDFAYRRTSEGCLIYSIGPNMKDDGGRPASDPAAIWDKGDLVWRMNR
jgi:hypothetical protein